MTTNKTFGLFFSMYSIMMLAFVFSCKKEKPVVPETKDPCECAREVTADFTMEELTNPFSTGIYTETDTILKEKNVRFTALEEDAEYTWYMGVEELGTREVNRYFDQSLSGSNLPITLVVKKEPNKLCFPDDDGYDSITKTLHVSQYPYEDGQDLVMGSIEGTYRLKSEHLLDSFDITFDGTLDFQGDHMFNITNYDGQGSDCINWAEQSGKNYRQIWTQNGPGPCNNLRGYIHNRLDGITEMKFTTKEDEDGELVEYQWHYLGRKL